MDQIIPKSCDSALIQPQLRSESNFDEKVELSGTAHELQGILNSFEAGW